MMKCFNVSIQSKFPSKRFVTLGALELLAVSLGMSSLLVSFQIRLSFESGAATFTIDPRQGIKILNIGNIHFSIKMLFSLVTN